MAEEEKFDGMLMTIAQQKNGIEPLLESVFSFLRRKTDFFTGASDEKIKETVLKVVTKQQQLAAREAQLKKEKQKHQEKMKLQQKQKKQSEIPRFEEITEEDNAPKPVVEKEKQTAKKKTDEEEDQEDEDDGPAPLGNGGSTENYVWTQTLQEAQVSIPVPEGTRGKQVDVDIRANKLKVYLKGATPQKIVDGELHKKIKVDDSFWTIEDGNRLCIYLQKDNQMEWWKCIIQGDPEIDTKKVQPENSKLGDLDRDTRQTVEKMMFDQRQKAQGLPSSDDLQKQEMMKKFMDQHPEMDFSKAKFN